jgi:hypothetical protein
MALRLFIPRPTKDILRLRLLTFEDDLHHITAPMYHLLTAHNLPHYRTLRRSELFIAYGVAQGRHPRWISVFARHKFAFLSSHEASISYRAAAETNFVFAFICLLFNFLLLISKATSE